MAGQPPETARELESILGKFSYVDNDNIQRTRSLMTMDEIRILKEEAIILCGNLPPIKAKMIPCYEQRELKRLAALPPYKIQKNEYEEELETINIDGKTQ
jgi:type IV secretory pathway TraG/TraD family ATPase VirD4